MRGVATFSLYLLKDFSRSLWVIVPPGVTLALYRVFFLYGSDSAYLASIGGLIMALVCLLTTLLLASRANRASTYPLLARLPHRYELVAGVALSSLAVTLVMAAGLLATVILGGGVPLTLSELLAIVPRWLAILLLVVAFGLHMSRLVSRNGSNWVAYIVLILLTVSYERLEYPNSALLDAARAAFLSVLSPVTTTLLSSGTDGYIQNLLITLAYATLLLALAIWLFRKKDLLWTE